jgi:hypothetical protein
VIEHSIDQGFVLVENTDSYGTRIYDTNILLVKSDSVGVVIWTRSYGGGSDNDGYLLTEQPIYNGLVIGGRTEALGAYDVLLIVEALDGVWGICSYGASAITGASHTITEAAPTFTLTTSTLVDTDQTLTEADQVVTTFVNRTNPIPSPSQSLSASQTQTRTQSQTRTQTAFQSQTHSSTQATSLSASSRR